MEPRPRNVNGLREELLAKEKELSSVQEFLLEQDDDLRSCLHRVGDLELNLLANRPDSCATDTDCGESPPPPREITPLRHELINGDSRAATAVAAQVNTPSVGNSNNNGSSGCMASYLPSVPSPVAGAPASSPPPLPADDGSSRRRIFAENASCCCAAAAVVGNGLEAPVTPPPNRNPAREPRCHRVGDGDGGDPEDFRHRLAYAAESTPSVVAPEPRRAPAAPTAPPLRPPAAVCAPSPSSDGRRPRVSPGRMLSRGAESGSNGRGGGRGGGGGAAAGGGEGGAEREGGGGEGGREGGEMSAAATAGVVSSPLVGSHRLGDRPVQEQGRKEPGGDEKNCFAMMGLAECDERVTHAERRAGAAEAAERSAAASAVTAMRGARAANEETERLRLEGLELSRWREAVLDLRDALRIAERDGGEGRAEDGGYRSNGDPVARHAKWVSSPALGTLLPHLQQSARDLLSDLVAARARIPASSAATTAASPAAPTRPSSGSTRIAAGDRGCACVPTAAERWSRDEGGRSGEARSRTYSFELQNRSEGQQQCAVCDGVQNSADYSRGARFGVGVGGGETGAAAVAAAVGPGVGHGVGDKPAASLEKECETLRIVVQALREKEEDSQRRITTLEERMLQASLAAVERDALVSVLRRQLSLRDNASDPTGEDNGGRGRTRSCSRGRAGFRGPMNAVSTPEQDVARSGRRSRLFADDVDVEPSPPPSTRLPRSSRNAASAVGDGSDPLRCCHRLSSSMLRSELQPEPSRGRRQACAHTGLDPGCCCQAEACCCGRSVQTQAHPSRDDSRRHPCDGNRERGRTAVAEPSPFGQAPSTPNAALASTETPPMVALRGGYRDRRGGGGGGTGCGTENASGDIRTPRTAKEEKRSGDPQVRTPTTDVIRRLLYDSTPTPQMDPGGSAGRIAARGRHLFSEDIPTAAFPGGSGSAGGVRGGTTAAALFSDSPCRRSGGSGDGGGGGPGESSSRGMGARGGRNGDGRATAASAVLAADANSEEGAVAGCSVRTATAMAGGRIAKGEIVLRERLLQARRDFSALRTGVPADELMP